MTINGSTLRSLSQAAKAKQMDQVRSYFPSIVEAIIKKAEEEARKGSGFINFLVDRANLELGPLTDELHLAIAQAIPDTKVTITSLKGDIWACVKWETPEGALDQKEPSTAMSAEFLRARTKAAFLHKEGKLDNANYITVEKVRSAIMEASGEGYRTTNLVCNFPEKFSIEGLLTDLKAAFPGVNFNVRRTIPNNGIIIDGDWLTEAEREKITLR